VPLICSASLLQAVAILGMRFYRAENYGGLTALVAFLHPVRHSLKYYFAIISALL